jgi:DNA-binding TFAR19-related protein (PDSD5 family)
LRERLTRQARTGISRLLSLKQRRTCAAIEMQMADLVQHGAVLSKYQQQRDERWKRQPMQSATT